jgi:predicted XRE-type DNA-binding protein
MNNLVTKATTLIYQMDNDQLNQVIEAIKLKRNHLAKQAVKSFIKGDLVQFTNKNGMKVNATVEKVNKKYIVVDAHIGGQKWRVPATMLTKLSDIGMSA